MPKFNIFLRILGIVATLNAPSLFADAALDQVGAQDNAVISSLNLGPTQAATQTAKTALATDLANQRAQNQAYAGQVGQQIVAAGNSGTVTTTLSSPTAPSGTPSTVSSPSTPTNPSNATNEPASNAKPTINPQAGSSSGGWNYGF